MKKQEKEVYFAKLEKMGKECIYALIDNPYECPIVIDKKGIIRFMSRFSKRLIGIDPDEAVGKHVKDVVKGTHLHEIVEEGKARIGDTLYIAGRQQLISRIPLLDISGNIIGAVGKGMLNEITKLWHLQQKVEHLSGQVQYYRKQVDTLKGHEPIIGESGPIKAVQQHALQAARTNSTVLITGESGTGKELVAYYIHKSSGRADGPFIRVNCASIPSELFESELFGYEEGAFTGARSKGKPGKFELAQGGTILLDEIGELSLSMQAKLLRVLQERTIDRLGSTKPLDLDVRLIAATNRELSKMIRDKQFRMDLYFRINIFNIHTPSLKELRDDIPLIAESLMSRLKNEIGWGPTGISDAAMVELMRYPWPGNVRELRNVLERAIIVSKDRLIGPDDLPDHVRNASVMEIANESARRVGSLKQILEETEARVIKDTLRSVRGNKARAAKLLGIHRTSLYEKLKKIAVEKGGISDDDDPTDLRFTL